MMWGLLRRVFGRIFSRPSAREAALTALCVWGFWLQFQYRTTGLFPFLILPWLGLSLAAVSAFALIVHVLGYVPTKDPLRREIRLFKQLQEGLLAVFMMYSVTLNINCALDRSRPIEQKSVIVDMSEGEFDIGSFVSYSRADLRSWKDPSTVEPVLLQWNEKRSLWVNEPVVVRIKRGALGMAWVLGIEPDEEIRMRQVLELAPTAGAAWKKLIWFYIQLEKWDDAVKTTLEYFQHYPDDAGTFRDVANALFLYRQFGLVTKVLDPVLSHRFDFDTYHLAAWNLGQDRNFENKERALQLAQTVVQMQPNHPLSYYLIGHVYYWMGNRPADALKSLEHFLVLMPGTAEVEMLVDELREDLKLRERVAARRRRDAPVSAP